MQRISTAPSALSLLAIALVGIGCVAVSRSQTAEETVGLGPPSTEPDRRADLLDRFQVSPRGFLEISTGRSRPRAGDPPPTKPLPAALRSAIDGLLGGDRRASAAWRALCRELSSARKTSLAVACWQTARSLAGASPGRQLEPYRQDLAAEALDLRRAGRYSEAAERLRESLALGSEDPSVHRTLAAIYHLLEEPEKALHHAEEAIRGGAPGAPSLAARIGRVASPPAAVRSAVDLTVGQPMVIDGGEGWANEPQIVAPEATPGRLVAGWITDEPGANSKIAFGVSEDGGLTWERSILDTPEGIGSPWEGDPMIAVEPETGFAWVGGLSLLPPWGVSVAPLEPSATSPPPSTEVISASFVDKPLIAAGPDPDTAGATRLYVAHDRGVQRSTDRGASWSEPVFYDPARQPGSLLGAVPRIGPNGELYTLSWDIADQLLLSRSVDGGQTFEGPFLAVQRIDTWFDEHDRNPGTFRIPPIPALAVDPLDGTLYAALHDTAGLVDGDADLDVFVSRSEDGGETWTTPASIHVGAPIGSDQAMPWIEVDRKGRVHVVFLDTRRTPGQADDDPEAWLDVTYALSTDRGESWTEVQITPQPFSSRDPALSDEGVQFLGDYLGLTVGGDTVLAAYPATWEGGSDLYFQRIELSDAPTPTGPCIEDGPTLCLTGGRFRLRATWERPDGSTGSATGHPLTGDSGVFWFFRETNVELIVKVLDACGSRDRFWVFLAGLTNLGVHVTVEDTWTGEIKSYENPLGTPYPPTFDTGAFATCDAPSP